LILLPSFALARALLLNVDALTLDQAVAVAEANSFVLRNQRTQIDKARLQIDQARGLAGPKLTGNANYNRFFNPGPSFGGPVQRDQTQAQLTLAMPVDVAGVTNAAISAARKNVDAQNFTLESNRQTLRLQVTEAYVRVLQAEAIAQVAKESVDRAKERLDQVEKEFQVGSRAKVEVLRLETGLKQAESDLVAAQNAVSLAKNLLNNSLGRAIETPITVSTVAIPEENPGPDVDAMVKLALDQRPEVKSLSNTLVFLSWVTKVQRGGLTPSLNWGFQHTRQLGTVSAFSQRSSTVGFINLSWPLFDSGVTKSQVNSARQDEEAARTNLEQLKLGISLEVRQAMLNVLNAKARRELAEKQVELAKENFRLVSLRFDNQEGIALEVADANTQLTQAQTGLVNAQYDYLTAVSQLRRALGYPQPEEKK
jgi:outer membrane protein